MKVLLSLFSFFLLFSNTVKAQSFPTDTLSDYGQIFIEDTDSPNEFDYKFTVLGGTEIRSPYISSYFIGFEVQKRINPLVYFGLDYSFHISNFSSISKDIKNNYRGLDISYPFLKHSSYINVHYHIFKSHLNLASFYKIRLDVPLQIGLGIMSIEEQNLHLGMKWGVGPRIQFSPRWEIQILFYQTVSEEEFDFLYTWSSVGLTFNF